MASGRRIWNIEELYESVVDEAHRADMLVDECDAFARGVVQRKCDALVSPVALVDGVADLPVCAVDSLQAMSPLSGRASDDVQELPRVAVDDPYALSFEEKRGLFCGIFAQPGVVAPGEVFFEVKIIQELRSSRRAK